MYRSELHSILVRSLDRAKWTRSTRDEDNFRQVICSHLYEHISPNNTEIPSTRSGAGDIRIFGRKIELKYVNSEKRDGLDSILADIDLLLEKKVEFCIVALRLDVETRDNHLVHTVGIPLLRARSAVAPIANHPPHNYYGPGIFLPACFTHENRRITVTEGGVSHRTNSYLSLESAHNLERSCFLQLADCDLHVDVIGSREDGLLILLYKRADDITFETTVAASDILVPYDPAPIRIASISRVNVQSKPGLRGRRNSVLEQDVSRIAI